MSCLGGGVRGCTVCCVLFAVCDFVTRAAAVAAVKQAACGPCAAADLQRRAPCLVVAASPVAAPCGWAMRHPALRQLTPKQQPRSWLLLRSRCSRQRLSCARPAATGAHGKNAHACAVHVLCAVFVAWTRERPHVGMLNDGGCSNRIGWQSMTPGMLHSTRHAQLPAGALSAPLACLLPYLLFLQGCC